MTTTPTQPPEHEALTSTLYVHRLFEGDDADGPSVCGCGLVEPDDVFYADYTNGVDAERQWHAEHLTTEVIAALAKTGVLATEQEWRVVSGGSTSPYATSELASREVKSLAGIEVAAHVESRRVTAWTEVDA